MTSHAQQDSNTMQTSELFPTSSYQMMSPFTSEAAPMYNFNQYYSPISFTEPQPSGIAYSQTHPLEFSWSESPDQAPIHRPATESPCPSYTFPTNPWPQDLGLSQPKKSGQSESDSRSDSASLARRRERRKIQNRLAQRNFRARKDGLVEESSNRLRALENELSEAKSANGVLSAAVESLMKKIDDLNREISNMKQSPNASDIDWEFNWPVLAQQPMGFEGEDEELEDRGYR